MQVGVELGRVRVGSKVITFDYVANDGTVNSAPATVTITVNGVNDAPVSGGVASASGTEDDASIGGTVPAASDVDVEPLTYALVAGSGKIDGVTAAEGRERVGWGRRVDLGGLLVIIKRRRIK